MANLSSSDLNRTTSRNSIRRRLLALVHVQMRKTRAPPSPAVLQWIVALDQLKRLILSLTCTFCAHFRPKGHKNRAEQAPWLDSEAVNGDGQYHWALEAPIRRVLGSVYPFLEPQRYFSAWNVWSFVLAVIVTRAGLNRFGVYPVRLRCHRRKYVEQQAMRTSRRNTRRTSSSLSSSVSSPTASPKAAKRRATASCVAAASSSAAPSRPSGSSSSSPSRTSSPSHRTFPSEGVATYLSLYARVQRASDAYSYALDGISAKTSRRSARDIHTVCAVRKCWRQAMLTSRRNDTPHVVIQSRKTARDHGLRGCIVLLSGDFTPLGLVFPESFAHVVALTPLLVLSQGVATYLSLDARVQRASDAYCASWKLSPHARRGGLVSDHPYLQPSAQMLVAGYAHCPTQYMLHDHARRPPHLPHISSPRTRDGGLHDCVGLVGGVFTSLGLIFLEPSARRARRRPHAASRLVPGRHDLPELIHSCAAPVGRVLHIVDVIVASTSSWISYAPFPAQSTSSPILVVLLSASEFRIARPFTVAALVLALVVPQLPPLPHSVVPIVVTITAITVNATERASHQRQERMEPARTPPRARRHRGSGERGRALRVHVAHSDWSVHAPPPAPLVISESEAEYWERLYWNQVCDKARSDLSPPALGRELTGTKRLPVDIAPLAINCWSSDVRQCRGQAAVDAVPVPVSAFSVDVINANKALFAAGGSTSDQERARSASSRSTLRPSLGPSPTSSRVFAIGVPSTPPPLAAAHKQQEEQAAGARGRRRARVRFSVASINANEALFATVGSTSDKVAADNRFLAYSEATGHK
ncbi:hypothetical protein K438DRAFT_1980224 [Mycena galopus ATCC 62051]|nr:hypothetical protein K438DRAFT_1980224 [Mycena galopus ATCC 62051]